MNQKELALGIELGSTRIKAVLVDKNAQVLVQGGYEWENILVDGLWSYSLEKAVEGLQASYLELANNYQEKYKETLYEVGNIGISGMMHGYIALDKNDQLLAPFRTWRNTNAGKAAEELSKLFSFNLPMRWSVAQYYESILEGMEHVKNISYLTTLAGYIHYLLTGEKVVGINEASGMFPVDETSYEPKMMQDFNALITKKGYKVPFETILPKVLLAGQKAGNLTEKGAKLLDPTGKLKVGIPFCPPEGDMGTGVIATNSIMPRKANISSGTSVNLTVVLEKALQNYYKEIDVLSTPDGKHCALIHVNNGSSEIDTWANLFREVLALYGIEVKKGPLLDKLFQISENSDEDIGKMVGYNYLAGEPMAGTEKGFLMLARPQDGKMNLANMMQVQVYSTISVLSLGMEMLKKENVGIDSVLAHGGYYKAERVGQIATSALLGGIPVTVMGTASEGGAWGVALLALYMNHTTETLPEFLNKIFAQMPSTTLQAEEKDIEKYSCFLNNYKKFMPVETLGTKI